MKTQHGISILLLFFFLLLGCQQPANNDTPATAAATEVAPAVSTRAAPGTMVLAEGQLVAVNPVLPLAFETSGRLLAIEVQPGSFVNAGDLLATLDDAALRDSVTVATQQVRQAEVSLAQVQLSLDRLRDWTPDETAIAVAEANVAAAEANLTAASSQDAAAGNGLTTAGIRLDQARQALTDAQEVYDTAFDPARAWELNDPFRSDFLERERDGATRNLAFAQDNVAIAQADYNLAVANLNRNNSVNAELSLLNAQQSLELARTGPTDGEIAAADLQVSGAELALAANTFALDQAEATLDRARLHAPWAGIVLSVDAAAGAIVGAGTPILTLLDGARLQFHTSNVSERDLGQLAPGQPVSIDLKAYPGQTLTGVVAGIGPQATGFLGDAAVFPIWIDLTETDLVLRPGMTGRAEIRSE